MLFHENESITGAAQPGDLRFTVSGGACLPWVTFLLGFLPHSNYEYVFSHGDLWMANIIADFNHDDAKYIVSGIIEWETNGFYPEYFESSKLLGDFGMGSKADWYAYLPASTSPERYPIHWLVHRLVGMTVELS